jgi:SNF2 family DNA or RNA helicase
MHEYVPRLVPGAEFVPPSEALLDFRAADVGAFVLQLEADRLKAQRGFEKLLCLADARIEQQGYQVDAALRVLRQMRGCAILADEVGLGKTIEAGLILKEYVLRGMVRNALILVPPALADQWQEQMGSKFDLGFRIAEDELPDGPWIIVSLSRAKGERFREALQERFWDLVIVDEAHSLKNHQSAAHRFVYGLQKKYALLLTATPVHNDLRELFNLITIARPGHLKSRGAFKKEFMEDRRTVKNVEALKRLLSEVMIRNRRSNTLIKLPRRHVENVSLELSAPEREFYDRTITFCRDVYRRYVHGSIPMGWDRIPVPLVFLVMLQLFRELCSSPGAAVRTLRERGRARIEKEGAAAAEDLRALEDLVALGASIRTPAKVNALVEILARDREKTIVYVEFLETQRLLAETLRAAGLDVVVFEGSLDGRQKREALRRFEQEAQVFLSTDAGGQGLNLQFCRNLVNYDLPWNPMKLEQRIGRIHRFGQERDVRVTNLVTKGTIEAYLLHILNAKIGMFTSVVGEIETILAYMKSEARLDRRITEIVLESEGPKQIEEAMRALGDEIEAAWKEYREDSTQSEKALAGAV